MLVYVQKEPHELRLVETHNRRIDEMLRPTIYQNTSVFLLCFAVGRRSSFDSVAEKVQIVSFKFKNANSYCV